MRLSRVHYPVTALGPGNRIGIWFQGCTIRCPGCISTDTWAETGDDTDVVPLLAEWAPLADGATITGGEPLEQPEALTDLIKALRALLPPHADILLYTGRPFEAIEHLPDVDALITDPFDVDAPMTLPLRGSDNQRLHLLTPLGRDRYARYERPGHDNHLDVVIDDRGDAWIAGIPHRGDLERLRAFLEHNGARAQTTEHRR